MLLLPSCCSDAINGMWKSILGLWLTWRNTRSYCRTHSCTNEIKIHRTRKDISSKLFLFISMNKLYLIRFLYFTSLVPCVGPILVVFLHASSVYVLNIYNILNHRILGTIFSYNFIAQNLEYDNDIDSRIILWMKNCVTLVSRFILGVLRVLTFDCECMNANTFLS